MPRTFRAAAPARPLDEAIAKCPTYFGRCSMSHLGYGRSGERTARRRSVLPEDLGPMPLLPAERDAHAPGHTFCLFACDALDLGESRQTIVTASLDTGFQARAPSLGHVLEGDGIAA